jgi:PTS system nitrogen regulatory IIA component
MKSPALTLLSKLLPLGNVTLDLDATSKKRLFEHAGLAFERNQQIPRGEVFDSLFAREKLGSTGLGQGVAIPHGCIKGVKEAVGAFLRLSNPVPFDAPDGKPVSLVFVLLVPERTTDLHLQILSELAQLFSDKTMRDQLLSAENAETAHRLIVEWKPNAPGQRNPAV